MSDIKSTRTGPNDRDPTSPPGALAALERFGTKYRESLEELAECNLGLARLVQVRVARPWTDFEYDAYVRLRRSNAELNFRVMRARRAFERARSSLRDRWQPF